MTLENPRRLLAIPICQMHEQWCRGGLLTSTHRGNETRDCEKCLGPDYPDYRSGLPQLPVSRWHEQIGDPTLADGILDRLVHNAHRIEMRGDSMRKNRAKPST